MKLLGTIAFLALFVGPLLWGLGPLANEWERWRRP